MYNGLPNVEGPTGAKNYIHDTRGVTCNLMVAPEGPFSGKDHPISFYYIDTVFTSATSLHPSVSVSNRGLL